MKKIFSILIILLSVCSGYGQTETMSFVSYNVLHGFDNDSLLEDKFIKWAINRKTDIFAFQELNGFTQEKLEVLAGKYGHPYAVINTGVTHPIGITSKYPIVMTQHVTTNMWHSYLYGNINGVHVFVTHLSPFEVNIRRNDIDRVIAHAKLLPDDDYKIILGDFNSLAAVDSLAYGDKLLSSMMVSEGRLEPKSGLPIVKGKTIYRNNLDNGKMDYTVTQKMISAGFNDVCSVFTKAFKHSVPTERFRKSDSHLRRIDYIWTNRALSLTIKEADIIHDNVTKELSDHYPVFVKVQLNSK